MIWGSAMQSKYFQRCIDKNDEDCKFFGNYITWIEITMNFEKQKLGLTHDQHVESSTSDHSITTFPLIASYFLPHLCVINLLVQTLKKYKNTHSKEKMKMCSNLDWKSGTGTLLIGDGHQLVMGTSTIPHGAISCSLHSALSLSIHRMPPFKMNNTVQHSIRTEVTPTATHPQPENEANFPKLTCFITNSGDFHNELSTSHHLNPSSPFFSFSFFLFFFFFSFSFFFSFGEAQHLPTFHQHTSVI